MASKEDVFKKLGAPQATAATPAAPTSAKDGVFKKLGAPGTKADVFKKLDAPGAPVADSPWDNIDMDMLTQIGKVLGSSFLQAEAGIAGMPGDMAELYDSGIKMLPESTRPFAQTVAKVTNPVLGVAQAARAIGAPTSGEIAENMDKAGVLNTPERGSVEDWAQYGLSNLMTSLIPIGQQATLANAGKSVATQVLPAIAAKGVQDAAPDTPGLGLIAAIGTALAQHGVVKGANLLSPTSTAARTVAADLPKEAVNDFGEYTRLGLPAKAVDVMGPEGVSAVAGVSTRRAGGSRGLVQEVAERQDRAPLRIKEQFTEAANPGRAFATRQQLEAEMEASRKAIADAEFPTVREGQTPVNIHAFGRKLRDATADTPVNARSVMEELQAKYFNRLAKTEEVTAPDGSVRTRIEYTKDPKRIYATLVEMERDAQQNPQLAAQIGALKGELDGTLETAYPHYADMKETFRKASEKIEALNAGAEAGAKTKLPEDVTAAKARLGARPSDPNYVPTPSHIAALEQAFKQGHADSTVGRVIHTKEGGNATNSLNSVGMQQELTDVYGPDMAKTQQFEQAAANTAGKITPVSNAGVGGIINRIVGNPLATVAAAATAPAYLTGQPWLAGGAAALSAGGILRKLLSNKELIKAAKITDPAEFQKFLDKAISPSLKGNNLIKSGIIGQIAGGR